MFSIIRPAPPTKKVEIIEEEEEEEEDGDDEDRLPLIRPPSRYTVLERRRQGAQTRNK